MTASTAVLRRNAALDAAWDVLNNGSLRVLDGTKPASADTALGAQVSLADLTFGATAFAAAAAGSKAANAITQDSSINASATATWAALQVSGQAFNGTRIMDISVGTSGQDLNFNSVGFSSGATCQVTSLTISQAA